jgi:hypothetical protein
MSIGFENRISNNDGKPSFFRTPTLKMPQWIKTLVPGRLASSSQNGSSRSSATEYRCIAGNRQTVRKPRSKARSVRSIASAAIGLIKKYP